MPKHIYEGTDVATNPANRNPIGLGPYKFVKWEEGRGITFARNENYWNQPKPYLDSVVVVFIPDASQQMNALYRGGKIHVLTPTVPNIPRAESQSKFGKFGLYEVKMVAPQRLSIDVNTTRDFLSKPLVRQAILTAIDRRRITRDVYHGLAFIAGNAIPEQFETLTDSSIEYAKLYPFDPVKAGKMLDQAGYPLKGGKRFSLGTDSPEQCRVLLRRAGITDRRSEP